MSARETENCFAETALDLAIQHQALKIEQQLNDVLRQRLAEAMAQRAELASLKIFLVQHGGCLPQK